MCSQTHVNRMYLQNIVRNGCLCSLPFGTFYYSCIWFIVSPFFLKSKEGVTTFFQDFGWQCWQILERKKFQSLLFCPARCWFTFHETDSFAFNFNFTFIGHFLLCNTESNKLSQSTNTSIELKNVIWLGPQFNKKIPIRTSALQVKTS